MRITGPANGTPTRQRELEATVKSVPGIDAPIAATLALRQRIPWPRWHGRERGCGWWRWWRGQLELLRTLRQLFGRGHGTVGRLATTNAHGSQHHGHGSDHVGFTLPMVRGSAHTSTPMVRS